MIMSFSHKGLKSFYESGSKKGIQAKHAKKLRLQLAALNTASIIGDMNIPGWNLHELKGNKAGRWSIIVNGNWRVVFNFEGGNAYIVSYEDYH
jgi:toxin HigB-1